MSEQKEIDMGKINYFGGCTVCGGSDGHLNIGRGHFGVCHKHKKYWVIGSNLFSNWRHESEEDWLRNEKLLSEYEEIKPLLNPEYIAAPPEAIQMADPLDDLPF